ncbi:MAG: diol dehydratase reactivase subunit alpha, partial [Herbinix sp.]|nr:diol dehydratase reactivase subunit alpha [Herbinix sp.]
MKLIAGVDIGNSTTEVCIGKRSDDGKISFLASASKQTTGTKGTLANVPGIKAALEEAMGNLKMPVSALSLIRINEATPVIGDTAMETITETIITESSMIGHNPATPAGTGQAVGTILHISKLDQGKTGLSYIITADSKYTYEKIAELVNQYSMRLNLAGIILQADEAVLVWNRLARKIPIVDEVKNIDQ